MKSLLEPTGMYGKAPTVQVGRFTISRQDKGSVWIEREDGEGGAFFDELVEKMIEDFYNKHF